MTCVTPYIFIQQPTNLVLFRIFYWSGRIWRHFPWLEVVALVGRGAWLSRPSHSLVQACFRLRFDLFTEFFSWWAPMMNHGHIARLGIEQDYFIRSCSWYKAGSVISTVNPWPRWNPWIHEFIYLLQIKVLHISGLKFQFLHDSISDTSFEEETDETRGDMSTRGDQIRSDPDQSWSNRSCQPRSLRDSKSLLLSCLSFVGVTSFPSQTQSSSETLHVIECDGDCHFHSQVPNPATFQCYISRLRVILLTNHFRQCFETGIQDTNFLLRMRKKQWNS
jgi:hypothetical protein